ncbi:hypothetical protein CLV30_11993 [Haloactinopolyspora alba]|uniref:Uncharacterized protein n=1 Tax=Haloactinopolyspora alba TaxID=648780 RepID=A0A2P8DND5_9ACTN|nr:hypothetical protein [Haloactinopolyspora alba]PSK98710.1 hypothetical protein CLV30_11993 [Haloactinopolyspora alba]
MTTSANDNERLQAALDDLTDALEAHLQAVLGRSGEADTAVQSAYTALRQAAERYDDLLFDLRDEVTPWEFPEGPPTGLEYEDDGAVPGTVGVLVRRDYTIGDGDALLGAGREAYGELYPDDPMESAVADVSHPGRALYQMLHAYGVDGFDERAEDAGLSPRGGTVWVQALPESDSESLTDDPFGVADENLLVYRVDEIIHTEEPG